MAHLAPRLLLVLACIFAGVCEVHAAGDAHGAASEAAESAETKDAAPSDGNAKPEGEKTAEGEEGEAEPPPPALWPETPAVETEKQPYVLMRTLRSVQDQIAQGSTAAHEQQRKLQREIAQQVRDLPPAVWDDVRNVRAAVFFVLSGGDASILKPILSRPKTPFVDRRLVRATLAYGEGRFVDALGMIHKVDARTLDPLLGGIVALIQGTLIAKKDPKKSIAFFDDARLLAPGTLVEESALRQEILILAREGNVEQFDLLAEQYARRFPRSLFAQTFRRQFFAGVARRNFKPESEWLARTETELMRAPLSERAGLYLAIADEATKSGAVDIARFSAGKARELAPAGSRTLQRAMLYEGAALVATEDFEKGIELLNGVDLMKLTTSERQIHSSAVAVALAVGKWPVAAETLDEPPPGAVSRAESLLTEVDTLLEGVPQ